MTLFVGFAKTILFVLVLWLPAWWLVGRLSPATPFLRLLTSIGVGVVGYLTFVNLLGRLTEQSISSVYVYLLINATGCVLIAWRARQEASVADLFASWRSWITPLIVAVLVGVPQWMMGVSTPFWDEVASGAIHLTAPNQFAEGLFPPRYNAFPDIPLKYHYASTILVGSLQWLTGLSANACIDLLSTGLWLFVFLFLFHWFRQLKFARAASYWSGIACLLGGGLAWLYIPRIESYKGFSKISDPAMLAHAHDPALGWWGEPARARPHPGIPPAQCRWQPFQSALGHRQSVSAARSRAGAGSHRLRGLFVL